MTSGGSDGTSGEAATGWTARRIRIAAFAGFLLLGAAQGTANALSRMADMESAGYAVAGWRVAIDEATSFAAWTACLVPIWLLVAWLRPPRVAWPLAIALHLLATVAVSLLHVGLMVGLRHAIYGLIGADYDFGPWGEALVYEYRKDALSYVLIGAFCLAVQWLARERVEPPASGERRVFTVVDGRSRVSLPFEEIDSVEAAGNYVEIEARGARYLHRATLASVERALGADFMRIHRSRIVRREAVRRIETLPSGDFEATLADGRVLRGSRRYLAGRA